MFKIAQINHQLFTKNMTESIRLTAVKYRVISLEQQLEWIKYVQNSVDFDYYHTWHYHKLNNQGESILFIFQEEDVYIALPLIKRKIPNSVYFDLTAAYGYLGPISNRRNEDLDVFFIKRFKDSFLNFMHNELCISVFSRLNPFINQKTLIDAIGGLKVNGKTVCIDLNLSIDEQRSNYEKRLNRQIRQLRNANYIIKDAATLKEIGIFTNMYNENMRRIGANQSYFYNQEYFSELLQNKECNAKLITIYDGSQMICGAIVLYNSIVIHNHLSATDVAYINKSPSKLLTDEISIIGRKLGLRYFHLGGGLSGKNDSLFSFKSHFSKQYLDDFIWCYIANQSVYDDLVIQNNVNSNFNNFFPLYRSHAQ